MTLYERGTILRSRLRSNSHPEREETVKARSAARRATASRSQKTWLHSLIQSSPARFALLVFTGLILVWTALLSLPIATRSGTMTPLADSLFTAVSAICVTGLSTVNMAEHWSLFGDLVILTGLQIGGIGCWQGYSRLAISMRVGETVRRTSGPPPKAAKRCRKA